MPYIGTRTNIEITQAQELTLKEKLGKAVEILGKSESWLMVDFEDRCRLYFRGNASEPVIYCEVKLYGSASASAYEKMTAELCAVFHEVLGVRTDNIYVKYEEVAVWGWDGGNI